MSESSISQSITDRRSPILNPQLLLGRLGARVLGQLPEILVHHRPVLRRRLVRAREEELVIRHVSALAKVAIERLDLLERSLSELLQALRVGVELVAAHVAEVLDDLIDRAKIRRLPTGLLQLPTEVR